MLLQDLNMRHRKLHINIKKAIRLIVCLLLCCTIAGSPLFADSKQRHITVLLSGDSDIYLRTAYSFREWTENLADYPVTVKVITVSEDTFDTSTINGSDFLIAVGAGATSTVIDSDTSTHTLSILTPRITFDALSRDMDQNITAIYLEQPPDRQIALGKIIAGKGSSIGMLLGPSSINEAAAFSEAAIQSGISLTTENVLAGENPLPAIRSLIERSDLLLALYDDDVLNPTTAKWLLYMAYKNRKPIIGFSQAYVRAGAIAAVLTTPELVARQAAEYTHEYLSGKTDTQHNPLYPAYFSIAVNRSVAHNLKINLPDDDTLMQQMKLLGDETREPSR